MSRLDGVYVIGAGGHAKVVIRALQDLGNTVAMIFDDDPRQQGNSLLGIPIVGPVERILEQPCRPTVIAIGNNAVRRRIAIRYDVPWLTVVHPLAMVDSSVRLGCGTVVLARAVIQIDSCVGDHVIINHAATVDHDCVVGNYVHLAPGVHLAGNVTVEEAALFGIGAAAIPGMRIGAETTVGAGAAVVHHLPARVVAVGVPAKIVKSRSDFVPQINRMDGIEMGITVPSTEGLVTMKDKVVNRIYLSSPHMSQHERAMLLDAFDSNWIAPLGPHVDTFEKEFAAQVDAKQAVALSSGTAALHLALLLAGVKSGDEVLTSTLTFAATTNAITYVGASPVFIDSDWATWNMDPELLVAELRACARRKKLPKAVVVVDLYGQCADYRPIQEACDRYDVPIIEDAAEALGATYDGQSAGTFGTLGIFSFNGNKIITTSGGGMLVCESEDIAQYARFLATQARDPAPHYQHSQIGYNYRMSNLLAAVGRGQLRVLKERVEQRRANHDFYRDTLADLPGIDFMPEHPQARSTRWLTCITVEPTEFGATREDIRLAMEAENIESRPVWKPMHLQPVFSGCRVRGGKVAEQLFEQGLCLPSGSNLADEDRQRVTNIVHAVAGSAPATLDARPALLPKRRAA